MVLHFFMSCIVVNSLLKIFKVWSHFDTSSSRYYYLSLDILGFFLDRLTSLKKYSIQICLHIKEHQFFMDFEFSNGGWHKKSTQPNITSFLVVVSYGFKKNNESRFIAIIILQKPFLTIPQIYFFIF